MKSRVLYFLLVIRSGAVESSFFDFSNPIYRYCHEYSCEFGHRTARNRYKPNDREDKSDEGTVSWSVTHNRYLDMWLTQNEFEKNNIAFVNMIIWCEIGP